VMHLALHFLLIFLKNSTQDVLTLHFLLIFPKNNT